MCQHLINYLLSRRWIGDVPALDQLFIMYLVSRRLIGDMPLSLLVIIYSVSRR